MPDELPLWWRPPQLRGAEEDRRTSWLELFIDLMFVAIISALARGLALDPTVNGVAVFTIVFLPAWWVWAGLTVYNDRFEADDASHRLAFFVIMVALGGLAVSARHFFTDGFVVYAMSYVLARAVLIGLWIRAGVHNPTARPLTTRDAVGFGIAAAIWLVAIAVPWPIRLLVVFVAIAVDLGTPFTTLGVQSRLPRLSEVHLPERFGLFVLIVLGEEVIGVETIAARDFATGDVLRMVIGPAALGLSFVLWWLYFDHVAENPPPASPLVTLLWSYTHLGLVLALGMFGAAAQTLAAAGNANEAAGLLLLCATTGVAFALIGILEFLTEPGAEAHHPRTSFAVHVGTGAAAFALGFIAAAIGPLATIVVLIALGVAQVVYGYLTRAHHLDWDAERVHAGSHEPLSGP